MIATMPDERPDVRLRVENRLWLPQCCPISRNPRPGSEIRIRYRPRGRVLEVYALRRYLDTYVGGKGEVRAMEAMIQTIAADCAAALGVPVSVVADLWLEPVQQMRLVCRAGGTP